MSAFSQHMAYPKQDTNSGHSDVNKHLFIQTNLFIETNYTGEHLVLFFIGRYIQMRAKLEFSLSKLERECVKH